MKKTALMLLSGWTVALALSFAPETASAACPGDKKPSVACPGDKKPSACPGDKKPSACPDDKKKPSSEQF